MAGMAGRPAGPAHAQRAAPRPRSQTREDPEGGLVRRGGVSIFANLLVYAFVGLCLLFVLLYCICVFALCICCC